MLALLAATLATAASAAPVPSDFESRGIDRASIEKLLQTYTTAVSTKNEVLFETLLLNRDIPFSAADQAVAAGGKPHGTENYEAFRRGVFAGPPFTQVFSHVKIEQNGALAQVSLVFTNTSKEGSNWGYKTIQLLKLNGSWRIASEFFS